MHEKVQNADPLLLPRSAGEGVDVVMVGCGVDAAITVEEFGWALEEDGVVSAVPFPNTVRTPFTNFTSCWVWYQMQHWYSHLLFGAVLDLLARATGRPPM